MKKSFAIIHFHLWFYTSVDSVRLYTMFRYNFHALCQHIYTHHAHSSRTFFSSFFAVDLKDFCFFFFPDIFDIYTYNTQIVGTFNNT